MNDLSIRIFTDLDDSVYDVTLLWSITTDLPVTLVSVDALKHALSETWWSNEDGTKNVDPQQVVYSPRTCPWNARRINEADLSFPILLYKGLIFDGLHRLAKCILLGYDTIPAVVMTNEIVQKAFISDKQTWITSKIAKAKLQRAAEQQQQQQQQLENCDFGDHINNNNNVIQQVEEIPSAITVNVVVTENSKDDLIEAESEKTESNDFKRKRKDQEEVALQSDGSDLFSTKVQKTCIFGISV